MTMDFASQVGAFIGTSVILFIVTKPKRTLSVEFSSTTSAAPKVPLKGAKKYSIEGRKKSSFGFHDDFDM